MLSDFDWWAFLVIALCAWRVTRFLVFDSLIGANLNSGSRFSIVLDRWAFDANQEERSWWRGKVADLLTCPYCVGFWAALGAAFWWDRLPELRWVEVVWAIAAVGAVLSTWSWEQREHVEGQ